MEEGTDILMTHTYPPSLHEFGSFKLNDRIFFFKFWREREREREREDNDESNLGLSSISCFKNIWRES